MTDNPSQVMIATEDFVCEIDGERLWFAMGLTRVAASHRAVQIYPTRFRPVEEGLSYDDEMATSNPGERRSRAVLRNRQAVAAKEN
jgi:hypothetical protein